MKIMKILKTVCAIAGMGVAYIAAGKLGDKAKTSWDEAITKDDDLDDDEIKIYDLSPEEEPEKKTEEDET